MGFGGEDKCHKEEGSEVKGGHGSPQALLTQNELYSSHFHPSVTVHNSREIPKNGGILSDISLNFQKP